MAAGLRRLLGEGATWRSDKQGEAARTILGPEGRDESVIMVLPTGAGKSVLFMLPAVMRDTGTSIVVVPFVALADDLIERARLAGLDCIRFRSVGPPGARSRETPSFQPQNTRDQNLFLRFHKLYNHSHPPAVTTKPRDKYPRTRKLKLKILIAGLQEYGRSNRAGDV